ncbi:MAG: Nif3-like dinuclear metal center hexameric protein [Bacteroidetes bacterium]|nr:Nif3-like dinuclear metal center hexameric protein [Bacteroidota bacterium]
MSELLSWAPPAIAWDRDNIGLLVGRRDASVSRVLLCLDVTPEVVSEAVREEAELIIAHHPIIFHPLKALRTDETRGAMLAELLRRNINVIALHTNADATRHGLNHILAQSLGLQEIEALDPVKGHLRVLSLRIRRSEGETIVLPALAGAEEQVEYDCRVIEDDWMRIDLRAPSWRTAEMRRKFGLRLADIPHSFSEYRIEDGLPDYGIGSIGTLPQEMKVQTFLASVKHALACRMLRVSPYRKDDTIRRIAVCSGAGSSCIPTAIAAGADALVTGDLTHHVFLDYQRAILLVDAGHYETEHLFIGLCAARLESAVFENNEKIDILQARTNTNPIWFE